MEKKTKNHLIQLDFQELINNIQCGVVRCSGGARGQVVFANSSFALMLGLSPEECAVRSVRSFFADRKQYADFIRQLSKRNQIQQFEVIFKKSDDTCFWVNLSAVHSGKSSRKDKMYDLVVQDISQRKSIAEDLSHSKELFRIVFENSAAAITVVDQNERIVAWNPFAEKILDMNREDLFNKPIKELYPAVEWKKLRSFRIRDKGVLEDITTQILKKDGSLLDVNISISVLRNEKGEVNGSIAIIRDITRQKISESKLIESENKIRILLDNSAAAITQTDEQERIVMWNPYTERLYGYSKEELLHKKVSELYTEQEWKKIRGLNIRKTGSIQHLETQIVRKDGKIVDVDLSVKILRDVDGNITGSVGIVQDTTKQQKVRQMLMKTRIAAIEANTAKSVFLAKMSHEVRTPMNAIMGMIDLVLDSGLTPAQIDDLKVAKDAADTLLSLLNDILDVSKAEAGKMTIENIEINIHEIVKSVCKGMSTIADKKGVQLNWRLDEAIPTTIVGDPVRFRQIVINLMNNALKFTEKGSVTLDVKIKSQTKEMIMLHCGVIDTGIGIPKNRQEAVFDMFTQAEDDTTRKYGGTGLGLAICKKLTEMMGGEIWIESEPGKGSTFHFTLVFGLASRNAQDELVAKNEIDSEARIDEVLKGLRILLAEDNLINQKIAVRILEQKGCSVVIANNGKEVLELMGSTQFDIILMDDQMPEMSGVEATMQIRKNEMLTGGHAIVIAMTAAAMVEDRRRFVEAGMDGYVAKPINRQEMFSEIVNLVSKGSDHE